jgi:hypothetical protein
MQLPCYQYGSMHACKWSHRWSHRCIKSGFCPKFRPGALAKHAGSRCVAEYPSSPGITTLQQQAAPATHTTSAVGCSCCVLPAPAAAAAVWRTVLQHLLLQCCPNKTIPDTQSLADTLPILYVVAKTLPGGPQGASLIISSPIW